MSRILFALLICLSLGNLAGADPIRKVSVDEPDRLAKVCVQSFVKALLAGDKDAVVQSCDAPYRDPHGLKIETLDPIKKQFDLPPPKGLAVKIVHVVTLDKLNFTLKKIGQKELQDVILKDYGMYLGKEHRVVFVAVVNDGDPIPGHPLPNEEMHFLIKIKDGKAKIVGVCLGER